MSYFYSSVARAMGVGITSRNTQAIQNRFQKVQQGETEFLAEDLQSMIAYYVSRSFAQNHRWEVDWGEVWDFLTTTPKEELDSDHLHDLDILTYIVGDSW